MTDILYGIAAENPMLTDRALMRYADLASQAAVTPIRRYQLYRQALALRPSAAVQAKLLGYLSGVYALPALMLAAEYLDDAETAGRRGREDHRCQVQPDARRRGCLQGLGAGA